MYHRLLSGLAALALVACGGVQALPEFDAAAPESQALEMSIIGDAEEGVTTTNKLLDGDVGTLEQPVTGATAPECLVRAQGAVKEINDAVRRVLTPIATAIAGSPTVANGTTHVWPEKDHGNGTYKFTMRKKDTGTFVWKLEGKPKGSPDTSYVIVMLGGFTKGDASRRGKGVVGFDLDRNATVDSTFKGQGKLLVGFAHKDGYAALAYGLKAFTPDPAVHAPVDAVFYGARGPLGGRAVRLAFHGNLCGSPTAAVEFLLMRARWLPTVGGRADAIAWSGDVPAGRMYVANSCWDKVFQEGFFLVRDCTKGVFPLQCNATPLKQVGQVSNCAAGLQSESLPSDDPNSTAPEAGVESGGETTAPPPAMPPE